MSDTLKIHTQRTAELDEARRNAIICLCVEAHQESAVMRHLATIVAPDYEIAGLQTDDQLHFYGQVGWEEWRGTLAGRGANGELTFTADQKGIMILRLPRTPSLNLDGLLTIEINGQIW